MRDAFQNEIHQKEGATGVEPVTAGSAIPCSATELYSHTMKIAYRAYIYIYIYIYIYVYARVYKNASSGNRTRATTLATLYSTTEPMTLIKH